MMCSLSNIVAVSLVLGTIDTEHIYARRYTLIAVVVLLDVDIIAISAFPSHLISILGYICLRLAS